MEGKRHYSANSAVLGSPKKLKQKRIKTDSLLEESRLFRPTSPLKWHRKAAKTNRGRPKISGPLETADKPFYTPISSPYNSRPASPHKLGYSNPDLPSSFTFNHSSIFHEHLSDSSHEEERELNFNRSVENFSRSMEMLSKGDSKGSSKSDSLNVSLKPLAPLALSNSMTPLDIPLDLMHPSSAGSAATGLGLRTSTARSLSPTHEEFHDTRTSFRSSLPSLHGLTDINNEINNINAQINDINLQINGINGDKVEQMQPVQPAAVVAALTPDSAGSIDTKNILADLSSFEHQQEDEEDEEDSLRPLDYDLGHGRGMPSLPTTSTIGTLVDERMASPKRETKAPRTFATSASARTLTADRFEDPESIANSISFREPDSFRDSIRMSSVHVDEDEEEVHTAIEHANDTTEELPSRLNSSSIVASTPIELSQSNLFRTHQDRTKYTSGGVLDNRVSLVSTADQYPLDIDCVSPVAVETASELPFSLRNLPMETSHRDDYNFEDNDYESRPVSSATTHSSSLAGTASSTDSLGIRLTGSLDSFGPPNLMSEPLGFKTVSNNMGESSDDSHVGHASHHETTERDIRDFNSNGNIQTAENRSFAELNSAGYEFPELDDEPRDRDGEYRGENFEADKFPDTFPGHLTSQPQTPLSVHSQQFSYPPSRESYSPASLEEPIMHPPKAHMPFVFRSREIDDKDKGLYTQNNQVFVNNAFIPFYPSPENSPQFPNINSFPEVRGSASKEPPAEYLEVKQARDKEIARLTREFAERDKMLYGLDGLQEKVDVPDVFIVPATPLRVQKTRKDRLSTIDTPQIPKRSASRRSKRESSNPDSSDSLPASSSTTPYHSPAFLSEPFAAITPTTSHRNPSSGSTESSGTVIRHPLQNQFPSLPDNQMLFMTRTGQKQNFGQSRFTNPGGTHLMDLESQRESHMCRDSVSLLMLCLFLFMPPLWIAMGMGYLDSTAGEVKPSHKKAALVLGGTVLTAAVVGISVGLGVGLTR